MRRIGWILTVLAAATLALPAFAEEILHLKSGAAMPIVSHKVDGNMIHVDLGDNAFMAFPLTMVDRVERAGKNVILDPSSIGGTNVIRPRPDPTGSFPVRGQAQSRKDDKRRFDEVQDKDPLVEMDKGVMVYREFGNSSHPGKARTGVAWHQRILQNSGAGYRGATPIGNRQVIGGVGPRRSSGPTRRPPLTGIEFKPQGADSTTQGENAGDGGQTGSSDSGSGQ